MVTEDSVLKKAFQIAEFIEKPTNQRLHISRSYSTELGRTALDSNGFTERNGSGRRRGVFFLNGRSHHAQMTSPDRVIHGLQESIIIWLISPKINDFLRDWRRNDLGLFRLMGFSFFE